MPKPSLDSPTSPLASSMLTSTQDSKHLSSTAERDYDSDPIVPAPSSSALRSFLKVHFILL